MSKTSHYLYCMVQVHGTACPNAVILKFFCQAPHLQRKYFQVFETLCLHRTQQLSRHAATAWPSTMNVSKWTALIHLSVVSEVVQVFGAC